MDFGWDWSLAVAPQGIYGDVKVLKNVKFVQMHPIVVQEVKVNADGTGHATLDIYA